LNIGLGKQCRNSIEAYVLYNGGVGFPISRSQLRSLDNYLIDGKQLRGVHKGKYSGAFVERMRNEPDG